MLPSADRETPVLTGFTRLNFGRLAQLAERLVYTEKVSGSNPESPNPPYKTPTKVGVLFLYFETKKSKLEQALLL